MPRPCVICGAAYVAYRQCADPTCPRNGRRQLRAMGLLRDCGQSQGAAASLTRATRACSGEDRASRWHVCARSGGQSPRWRATSHASAQQLRRRRQSYQDLGQECMKKRQDEAKELGLSTSHKSAHQLLRRMCRGQVLRLAPKLRRVPGSLHPTRTIRKGAISCAIIIHAATADEIVASAIGASSRSTSTPLPCRQWSNASEGQSSDMSQP